MSRSLPLALPLPAVLCVVGAWSGCASSPPVASATRPVASVARAVESGSWSADAIAYRGRNNVTIAFDCPGPGMPGSVWGSGIYTDDSSVCTAAVHAGLITLDDGGRVTIRILPGRASYFGSEQNGVRSQDYAQWPSSFVFIGSRAGEQ